MKKLLSVTFALLILLSGMHLGLAAHLCDGKLFAAKFTFSGERASCGMESSKSDIPVRGVQLSIHCCEDEIAYFSVEKEYSPSPVLIKDNNVPVLQGLYLPVSISSGFKTFYSPLANLCLPQAGKNIALSPEDICVFRI